MNTAIKADPYNTQKKRVSWKSFERLIDCFKNDPRVFIVSESGDGELHEHRMTMCDLISFWDAGIANKHDMDCMLHWLEIADSCEIGQSKTTDMEETFTRIA